MIDTNKLMIVRDNFDAHFVISEMVLKYMSLVSLDPKQFIRKYYEDYITKGVLDRFGYDLKQLDAFPWQLFDIHIQDWTSNANKGVTIRLKYDTDRLLIVNAPFDMKTAGPTLGGMMEIPNVVSIERRLQPNDLPMSFAAHMKHTFGLHMFESSTLFDHAKPAFKFMEFQALGFSLSERAWVYHPSTDYLDDTKGRWY